MHGIARLVIPELLWVLDVVRRKLCADDKLKAIVFAVWIVLNAEHGDIVPIGKLPRILVREKDVWDTSIVDNRIPCMDSVNPFPDLLLHLSCKAIREVPRIKLIVHIGRADSSRHCDRLRNPNCHVHILHIQNLRIEKSVVLFYNNHEIISRIFF